MSNKNDIGINYNRLIGIVLNTIMGLVAAEAFQVRHQYHFHVFNIMLGKPFYCNIGDVVLCILFFWHLWVGAEGMVMNPRNYNTLLSYYKSILKSLPVWAIIIWSYNLI